MSERCGYGLLHVDGPCVYCERDEARAALDEEKRRAVCLEGERYGWQRSAEIATKRAEEAEEAAGHRLPIIREWKQAWSDIETLRAERDALAARLVEAVGVLRGATDLLSSVKHHLRSDDPARAAVESFLASLAPEAKG